MKHMTLDGALFVQMVLAGHKNLESNKQKVNALNVFPVPDGDTGTNMSLSFTSGVNEMQKSTGQPLYKAAEALATGLLMGARGNSGVILSQLFRGFSKAVAKQDSVDVHLFAEAFQSGVTTAYNAVVKPVEGTILTVAKDSARAGHNAARDKNATIESVMEAIVAEAEKSLAHTPELLPVLKQANVVDSGGQGLVCVYQGFLAALRGEVVNAVTAAAEAPSKPIPHGMPAGAAIEHEGEFGYCTEFIIIQEKAPASEQELENKVRNALMPLGDSMLVVAADNLVKVHIHALRPGKVLEEAINFGSLTRIKIDNMTEQHHNLKNEYTEDDAQAPVAAVQQQTYGMVAVAAGDGLADILKSLGVGKVVEGGQTMNPSTEDIVNAIESVNAEHVFVLPNNSNIIMAAEQAKEVMGERIHVIPTKTVPQGIAAVLAFDPEQELAANETRMKEMASRIRTGQITRAVRDSNFQDFEIKEGDYMGLADGKVVAVGQELELTALSLLEKMIDKDTEIVTVFRGQAVSEEDAGSFTKQLSEQFDGCEFELHYGGQPLYNYIFSVE